MEIEGEITHLLAYMDVRIPFHDFFQTTWILLYISNCMLFYLDYIPHGRVLGDTLAKEQSITALVYKWIPHTSGGKNRTTVSWTLLGPY